MHPATVDQVSCGQIPIRGESPEGSRQAAKDLAAGPVTRNGAREGAKRAAGRERASSEYALFSLGDRARGTGARRDVSHGHTVMWLLCVVWRVCAGMPKLAARR